MQEKEIEKEFNIKDKLVETLFDFSQAPLVLEAKNFAFMNVNCAFFSNDATEYKQLFYELSEKNDGFNAFEASIICNSVEVITPQQFLAEYQHKTIDNYFSLVSQLHQCVEQYQAIYKSIVEKMQNEQFEKLREEAKKRAETGKQLKPSGKYKNGKLKKR